MFRSTWYLLAALGACRPTVAGDELVSLGGPDVVYELVARESEPVIAVEFNEMQAFLYEEDNDAWRPVGSAPASYSQHWAIVDGGYVILDENGLFRSSDADTWESIGPGLRSGNGTLLGGTSDGSYWFASEGESLFQLLPGADEWTEAFTTELTEVSSYGLEAATVRHAVLGGEGTAWLANLTGVFRLAPDGSALEQLYGCDDLELRYCTNSSDGGEASITNLASNEDGDLYYVVHDYLFRLAADTGVAAERGRFTAEGYVANSPVVSMAAVGDTVYVTQRTEYEGGYADLLVFTPGESAAEILVEVLETSAEVVASSDGSHVYVHSPGVSELR